MIHFVVYKLNKVMGSDNHLALEEVDFSGLQDNSFETEIDALIAIKKEQLKYTDLVVLRQVYLTD